jgi:hypothetical protein
LVLDDKGRNIRMIVASPFGGAFFIGFKATSEKRRRRHMDS